MKQRLWCSVRRAARWYKAGFTAAAISLVSPELAHGLYHHVADDAYAQQGIHELTTWLAQFAPTDSARPPD